MIGPLIEKGTRTFTGGRQLWVPSVLQSSAMDCGPASLKALAEGFGLDVGYEALRDMCRTELDGTSIDDLELVARRLGLDAEQIMLPPDHLTLASARALPCILVVRLPNGLPHFVVAWRAWGPWIEIMDPTFGRRLQRRDDFLRRCYVHRHRVPAADWRDWAGSSELLEPLQERMFRLGLKHVDDLIEDAVRDPTWRGLAGLDAAVRLGQALRSSGAMSVRDLNRRLPAWLDSLRDGDRSLVPARFWSVEPTTEDPDAEPEAEPTLVLVGAVLVRALDPLSEQEVDASELRARAGAGAGCRTGDLTPPKKNYPVRLLLSHLYDGRKWAVGAAFATTALAAAVTVAEALALRMLLELGSAGMSRLGLLSFMLPTLGIVVAATVLVVTSLRTSVALGRRLEMRLRVALLERLPRLLRRYFENRLVSDLGERAHSLAAVEHFPRLLQELLFTGAQLLFIGIGLVWLVPEDALWVAAAVLATGAWAMLGSVLLNEPDLQERSQITALARHYLDCLQGRAAIRAHSAQRALRQDFRDLMVQWRSAARRVVKRGAFVDAAQALTAYSLVAGLVLSTSSADLAPTAVLLQLYWALQIPMLGRHLLTGVRKLPRIRTAAVRLAEPLETSEIFEPISIQEPELRSSREDAGAQGVELRWQNVTVLKGGRPVLRDIDATVEPGEHIAVVGPSGAGKSTLVGMLLGRDSAATGSLQLDGWDRRHDELQRVRRHTAWVAPEVALWNRPLLDNLEYATDPITKDMVAGVISETELIDMLNRRVGGASDRLGDAGRHLSGGEGQRVRLGRAMLSPDPKLVILDEAFRGVERPVRQRLLARARRRFAASTLLWVTHDVAETVLWPRIWVVEDGRLVEDGSPQNLQHRPGSRYNHFLQQDRRAETRWTDPSWRRLRLQAGELHESRS